MARILILGAQVPFTSGGQEVLVKTLMTALRDRGHEVDKIELPYSAYPKEQLLHQIGMWRSLPLAEVAGLSVDLVIATKFPTYYAKHPRKVVWLVHQHRPLYDLYGGQYSDLGDDPRDEALRQMLADGDRVVLSECQACFGISRNVVDRLRHFCGLSSEVLYPPLPQGDNYYSAEGKPYILVVGRVCRIKRVDLAVRAMPFVDNDFTLKVVGVPDEPGIMDYLNAEIDRHHLWSRVEFLGRVSNQELLTLYAEARAVFYAPFNEDYGYVTLEAMASSRAVVTTTDSGGVLEFVTDGQQGLVVAPNPEAVAGAFNTIMRDPELASRLGQEGRKLIEEQKILESGWDEVVSRLTAPLDTPLDTNASEGNSSQHDSSFKMAQ